MNSTLVWSKRRGDPGNHAETDDYVFGTAPFGFVVIACKNPFAILTITKVDGTFAEQKAYCEGWLAGRGPDKESEAARQAENAAERDRKFDVNGQPW